MANWRCRGPISDVRRVLASLVVLTPEESLSRARLLWLAPSLATDQYDYLACAELSEQSVRIGAELKDPQVVGWWFILASAGGQTGGDLQGAGELVKSCAGSCSISCPGPTGSGVIRSAWNRKLGTEQRASLPSTTATGSRPCSKPLPGWQRNVVGTSGPLCSLAPLSISAKRPLLA